MRFLLTAVGAFVATFVLAGCAGADAQKPVPAPPASTAPNARFDSARAWEHLRRQVAFGPRPVNSAALADTRRYIIDQLKAAGIETREQRFEPETPIGRVPMVNLVATIPGSRPERIAIATHYETKLAREIRFVGASDPASSVAAVLELGRVLAGRQNPFTIELLFFDGEEAINRDWVDPDNTYGSRHYVAAALKAGTLAGLKALVLLDLIGDRNLNIKRESNSTRWLTDIIWASAKRLGYGDHFLPDETPISDDHVPFLKAGVPAVDIIDLEYRAWHTPQDDLDAVSARSLQIVGDVVLDALPQIEKRLASTSAR
ncbi:MAG: M28 family peptidase [Vicinamibacterales bacterium]